MSGDRAAQARALIDFIIQKVVRRPSLDLDEDTPLVSSGLVDSFALVEVLLELERVTGWRIPVGRVSPSDFETVRRMLETADRVGTSP